MNAFHTTAAPRPAQPVQPVQPAGAAPEPPEAAVPLADCVLCGEPTEYPASTRGATLCPVCAWQEAQRTACSG